MTDTQRLNYLSSFWNKESTINTKLINVDGTLRGAIDNALLKEHKTIKKYIGHYPLEEETYTTAMSPWYNNDRV
jgi:hypothetical protein